MTNDTKLPKELNAMNKIVTINDLALRIEQKKYEHKSIVHCHGVFDLLHIGHIKYFEEAKSLGDILVVTLTPDIFVNKGPNRPAFNQILRAEAIAALSVVDYVAINEWPTAIETIQKLKPDFYVKGSDYKDLQSDITGNILLEKQEVEGAGGTMAFTSSEIFSSSNLINCYLSGDDDKKYFVDDLKAKHTYSDICQYVDELRDLKVLIIGEVIIDEYIFCNSVGKSGKEPVMVSQKIRSEQYAGGVLAVANHISDFCSEIKILSYLGDRDTHEDYVRSQLAEGIKFDWITKNNSPTILKTRYIDDYTKTKIQGIYDLNDANINASEEKEFIAKLKNDIGNYDLVIVVDYGHGLITQSIVDILENKSKYLSINTQLNSFNSSFHSISKYKQADYVCVHSGELRHDYRNRYDSEKNLMNDIYSRMDLKALTITQGKTGSMLLTDNGLTGCPAFAGKVIDRVGAGDTLLAITSLCVAKELPEPITLLLGSLSAAVSVATIGNKNISNKINLLKSIKTLIA